VTTGSRQGGRAFGGYRLLRSPLVWFALFLVCAELTLLAFDSRHAFDHDDYLRNITPLRNWPEYTACDREPGRPLAVLIGASQSMSPEFPDSRDTWFSMVRDRLEASGHAVDLRNWSVTGIRSDQIELLSLKALQCGAKAIIYVLSLANIDEKSSFRFDSHAADVDLIAGEPGLWPLLPGSLVFDSARIDQIALRVLRRGTATLRTRDRLFDVVAAHLDRRRVYHLLGHVRPPNSGASLRQRAAIVGDGFIDPGFMVGDVPIDKDYWRLQLESQRMPVFDAMYPNLDRRLQARGATLAWVFTAVNAQDRSLRLLEVSEEFHTRICERLHADGRACHDLSRAMPEQDFFPAGIASHFNAPGQRSFAELIYPIIEDAVH
jgi:hypothetical protein